MSFFVKLCIFDPPGSACIGLLPTVMQLILKKYHHSLSWMYICDCFALSNGSNREVLWIIPVFGVLFGQNMGIWPPGVHIYRVTPRFFAIYFEEIVSCFVLNVTFLKGPKGKKTTILTIFWSKIRRLTPWGDNKGSHP